MAAEELRSQKPYFIKIYPNDLIGNNMTKTPPNKASGENIRSHSINQHLIKRNVYIYFIVSIGFCNKYSQLVFHNHR